MNQHATSAYDAAAASFDQHRDLPAGVPAAIRTAVWAAAGARDGRRALDLGAGTGRVGRAFVEAGDRYVGVDTSLGMLSEFATRQRAAGARAICLVQADGAFLPFADGVFDAVMLMQVLSEGRGWRRLLADAQRVLRPGGTIVVGRTIKPEAGVDTRLKAQLTVILAEMGAEPEGSKGRRADALSLLESEAEHHTRVVATSWTSRRTPRRYLDRHQTGHRFSQLPEAVRQAAMADLSAWATDTFGSLDAEFPETYTFELLVFTFSKR